MKPEGVSVIVAVALVNPGAVAVTVTGPALASACMKNPGLLVEPCGIVITSWPVPAAVPLADSTSRLASLLVSVICCPPVGAGAVMPVDAKTSMSLPIVWSARVITGAVTVARIVRKVAGVLNPVGASTAINEVPPAAGSKTTLLTTSAPLKTTVPGVTVPTPGPPV